MNKSKMNSKTLNLQHLSHPRYESSEVFRLKVIVVSLMKLSHYHWNLA